MLFIYVILNVCLSTIASECKRDKTFIDADGTCQPYLRCHDYELGEEMTGGYVKRIFHAFLPGLRVIVAYPRSDHVKEDFTHGLRMVRAFQASPLVVELVGYCDRADKLQIVTKYYKYGSADRLDDILSELSLDRLKEFEVRLAIALDYLSIIEFLHSSPLGVRVMCDANDVNKTLSQFLISDQLRLVINDLDALPRVNGGAGIKCGRRQLFGDFVAPEQLWIEEKRPFVDQEMVSYNEKIDIWKIPPVVYRLLGNGADATQFKFRFFDLFSRCRNELAHLRPTAKQVGLEFRRILARQAKFRVEL